jgi:septum formation protein
LVILAETTNLRPNIHPSTHWVIHMVMPIVLASGSLIRAQLLRNANVCFDVSVPRVDEYGLKQSMVADGAHPRDIADALAEMKARKISGKTQSATVIGCDQVLDFKGQLISKPESPEQALEQLIKMRGQQHKLYSAAVIFEGGRPVWRHIGQVRLQMSVSSESYLAGYVERNWDSIRHSAGGYMLEAEGVRLFERVDGDYFNVLGMPLLEILNFLASRGAIAQ